MVEKMIINKNSALSHSISYAISSLKATDFVTIEIRVKNFIKNQTFKKLCFVKILPNFLFAGF